MRVIKFFNFLFITFMCFTLNAQKNFSDDADDKFMNESYFTALDLYKKAEIKEKKPNKKARINFQIAECYRLMVEPKQAQVYYVRAIKLKYPQEHPEVYLLLADVLKEQGEYEDAEKNYEKYWYRNYWTRKYR